MSWYFSDDEPVFRTRTLTGPSGTLALIGALRRRRP
jgi:hypothetical protein